MTDAERAGDVFRLAPDQEAAHRTAQAAFDVWEQRLRALLPAGSDIRHIGATAVPGCLTKGDLDIVVRVQPRDLDGADAILAGLLARNTGSVRTDDFSAFADEAANPPLGVQLTTIGGRFDDFHCFVERLLADPALVTAYNDLKRRWDGEPMDAYRTAKGAFVDSALAGRR